MPFPDREISFSYGLFSLKSFSGQARFIKNPFPICQIVREPLSIRIKNTVLRAFLGKYTI